MVFGGATRHWALAGLKRFTGLNCFGRGFELFWIKGTEATGFTFEPVYASFAWWKIPEQEVTQLVGRVTEFI